MFPEQYVTNLGTQDPAHTARTVGFLTLETRETEPITLHGLRYASPNI
jgi:hypothetical protein